MSEKQGYKLIVAPAPADKIQYVVLPYGSMIVETFSYFENAAEFASGSPCGAKIVLQHKVGSSWADIAHYIPNDRLAQLQKLRDQRQSLDAEIKKMEADL